MAGQVAEDVGELGCRQVSTTCDQELSTMALSRKLMRLTTLEVPDQVLHDHTPAEHSQSSGSIENGVKTVAMDRK